MYASDTLRFDWTIDSQNIGENTSFVKWTLYLIAGSWGRISSTASKSWSVTIDGNTYSGTNTVGIGNNESKLLASGTTTIWHNADGTKTFSYSFSQQFKVHFSGVWTETVSGSGTGTLDTIARGATLLTAPNFTDLDNPTITYTNPAGNFQGSLLACISWTGADDIVYRNISKTGTSYTFNFTDAERTKLRTAVIFGTSRSVKFYVTTIIGDYRKESTLTRTLTLTDAHPAITSFTAKDTNAATTAKTGNPNIWISGFSDITYTMAAQGKLGATIASYKASSGNRTVNSASGTIKANSDTITATVTDSRGNSTIATVKAANFIDYTPITCGFKNVKFNVDNEKGRLDFTITGNYFNGSFGETDNVISVYYRYKAEYEEYTDWFPAVLKVTDNGYECAKSLAGLDYRKNYYIEAKAADSLISVTSAEYKVAKVIPVFDWSKDDFRFNVPVYLKDATVSLDSMKDFVIEDGTNGTWFYRKWKSGRVELYGYQVIPDVPCNTALGSKYRTEVQTAPSFPFTVYSPKLVSSYESDGYGAFIWNTTRATTAKPPDYYLVRPTSSTHMYGRINYHVQGYWK